MSKIKRAKLLLVNKNNVIAGGFGAMLGKCRVGKVVSNTRRAVTIEFHDEDGVFTDIFHILNGTRIDDIGQPSGWRVNPSDWQREGTEFLPAKSTDKGDNGKPRLSKLSTQRLPMEHVDGNTQELLVEVWEDHAIGGKYLRACREVVKDGSIRKKQVPTLVPFSVLIKVLEEFNNQTKGNT